MIAFKFLISALCLLEVASSFYRDFSSSSSSSSCTTMPKPLNRSIKACWDNTMKAKEVALAKLDINPDKCVVIKGDETPQDMGRQVWRTFQTIRCYAIYRYGLFDSKVINAMDTALSEIVDAPEVCVDNLESVVCRDLDVSDDGVLFSNIIQQLRLLQGLYIGTIGS